MSTSTYICPSCGNTIIFKNAETRLHACVCGVVLSRDFVNDFLTQITWKVVENSNDIIQPGTRGVFENNTFEVLGRFRIWYEDSAFNYWTIIMDDGSLCYLAEGYGLYAILKKTTVDYLKLQSIETLKPGSDLKLTAHRSLYLQRKEKCLKVQVEGEVWIPESYDTFKVFDFASMSGDRLELFAFNEGTYRAYDKTYVNFKTLALTGLNDKPVKPTAFNCPKCGTSITVKTFPYAQSCGCIKCGSRLSLNNSASYELSGKDRKNENALLIPLGTIGKVKGISYEVIGYALKKDLEEYKWSEYTLYNREEGYAFLSEFKGHWIYSREVGDSPVFYEGYASGFTFGNDFYKLYNKYVISLVDTAGEFPYDIFDSTKTSSAEYICPPKAWISEKSKEYVSWFLAESISKQELEAEFPFNFPYQHGIGMIEPKGYIMPGQLIAVSMVAILIMIIIHFSIGSNQTEKTLINANYALNDSAVTSTFVTDTFALTKWKSNLQFEVSANIDNNWFDMDASLVNVQTGEEYGIAQGVEYYHGYEDGESWSEGQTRETTYLSSIPEGRYFIRIEATRPLDFNKINEFSVTVKNDVPMERNMLIFIFIFALFPAGKLYWDNRNERERWSNSNYSPYNYSEE